MSSITQRRTANNCFSFYIFRYLLCRRRSQPRSKNDPGAVFFTNFQTGSPFVLVGVEPRLPRGGKSLHDPAAYIPVTLRNVAVHLFGILRRSMENYPSSVTFGAHQCIPIYHTAASAADVYITSADDVYRCLPSRDSSAIHCYK